MDPGTHILVESVEHAVKVFEKAGGKVVSAFQDIDVGRLVVVEDAFGNELRLIDFSTGYYTTKESDDTADVT
jgi:predicted enzyme related to lactoylglutathione lyase